MSVDLIDILSGAASAGGSIFAASKAFRFVKEGQRGVLLTFGKAGRNKQGNVKIIKPGFFFQIPFIQHIETVHIQKNTMSFENLTVTLKNNLAYNFNAFIVFHIMDTAEAIEHVLFTVEDATEFVTVMFEDAIQEVMNRLESFDATVVSFELTKKVSDILHENGIEIDSCGVTSFCETSTSQQLRGLNYKVELAKANASLPSNVLSTLLGATPTVEVGGSGDLKQKPLTTDQIKDAVWSTDSK